MKKILGLIGIILCSMSAAVLTSCLSSDGDDGGMDPTTYKSWLVKLAGNYYGDPSSWKTTNKVYFYNDTISGTNKTDSIDGIEIRMGTDSTMIVYDVPGRIIAKSIKDDDELKEAIENAAAPYLIAKYILYSPQTNYISYLVYPYDMEYTNVDYKGGSHNVKVKFYMPTGGAWATQNGNSQTAANFCIEGIYLDGNKVKSIYDDLDYSTAQSNSVFQVFATR
ncbi:MAG: DUF4840 domain-containing protein [Prevotella sp.]